MAEWEWWFENWWAPHQYRACWRACDQCPTRASWIKWDREAGHVEYACDAHKPIIPGQQQDQRTSFLLP